MASYTYECKECKDRSDVIHGMNENPEIQCRHCKANMMRVITGGGGFKIDGAFHSMSTGTTKKADLRDHIDEIKKVGKDSAQADRDMSMPRSKG